MSTVSRAIDQLLAEGDAHVNAGRFAQAEACARHVLAQQPRNPRAHYLLGVAAYFQRRPADALQQLELALRQDRVNPQFHFVTAMCLAAVGRAEEAVTSYRRALQFRPAFFEALANLGNLYEGTGRFAEASDCYRRALLLRPDEPLLLNALGACALAMGDIEAAAAPLERAVQLRPGFDGALNNLANVVARQGQRERAVELLRRAVELRPSFLAAWINLGEQLYGLRRDAEAVAALDRALALEPGNDEVRHLRNAIAGEAGDRAPDAYVAGFFDRFAAEFDQRLTGDLEYRTPQALAAMLEPWLAGRSALRVADLGCGTGLSGVFIRPHAARLVGIDLSGKMLDQARARGIYDELQQSEIAAFLEACAPASLDLALAVDVFVYVGNLEPVMRACAAALDQGGRFAFSVEKLDGDAEDYRLARTGRYAHARRYVERLAADMGLRMAQAQETVIRKEDGAPVRGELYVLEK